MRIKLYTKDGGFVAEFDIPPFKPPPEVVTWGTRCFVFEQQRGLDAGPDAQLSHRYREGLMYPLLEGYTAHVPSK